MKNKIEITIKCTTAEQAVEALENIALQIAAGFKRAPNDIQEWGSGKKTFGFCYDVFENDGTDIYGNELPK